MFSIRITVLAVATMLAILDCVRCEESQAAGKCRPICPETVPIDFERLARLGNWSVMYGTYLDVDDERMYSSPIVDGVFRLDNHVAFENQSDRNVTYTITYVDNVVTQETVDEKGIRHQFRLLPLAFSKEDCIFFYRCSDAGRSNIDTRFIVSPNGVECSGEAIQYLLAIDKMCNFNGKLRKLPKRHNK